MSCRQRGCGCEECKLDRGITQLRRLRAEIDELMIDSVIDGRERTLTALYEAGWNLDVGTELVDTATLNIYDFNRHTQRIRAHYSRDAGRAFAHQARLSRATAPRLTHAQTEQVTAFRLKHAGTSYQDAVATLFPGAMRQAV